LQVRLSERSVDTVTTNPDAAIAETLLSLHGRMRRALLAGKADDITASQTAVLGRLIREGEHSTADLARLEGVRPQSMGATVQGLVDLGLAVRESDPSDKRKSVVRVTDAGRAARDAAHLERNTVLVERLATLSAADRTALTRGLDVLGTLLDP
jgi:DNA-binding MarR family transcriptional regulator